MKETFLWWDSLRSPYAKFIADLGYLDQFPREANKFHIYREMLWGEKEGNSRHENKPTYCFVKKEKIAMK